MTLSLDTLRSCFEGIVPATIATCANDGTPNVAILSQVHYLDNRHVALSFQFFNKTRQNILANPYALVSVIDPDSAAHYQIGLRYLRTETEGPLFENMKAKLAGIASHTGMSKVFRLLGSDVYEVLSVACENTTTPPSCATHKRAFASLRSCTEKLAQCGDLSSLLDEALDSLAEHFAIRHAMLLMLDETGQRLFTVASRGYEKSGVGSEILLGDGIIGVAAREQTPIRIGHMASEYLYGRTVREQMLHGGGHCDVETAIPLPGLAEPHSQLAVPISRGKQLLGALYVESPEEMRFTYEDEDALVVIANQLALSIQLLGQYTETQNSKTDTAPTAAASGTPLVIRHYACDGSVFIDEEYLIKGVAGAIIWKLLRDTVNGHRNEFTNRELRLDPTLKLPDLSDNLEARLILLQRRLAERCGYIRLEKTGRGRFQLALQRPVQLVEMQ